MLKFVGVSKFYDEKEALSNISFELDKGDFLFIVGPSGAGKTTILKLIHKEIEPSRGEIFFNNDSLKKYNGKVYLLRIFFQKASKSLLFKNIFLKSVKKFTFRKYFFEKCQKFYRRGLHFIHRFRNPIFIFSFLF